MLKNLKKGIQNYFLYKKIATMKINRSITPVVMFMTMNRIMEPFKRVPYNVIFKAEKSAINDVIIDSLKTWNKSVSFITKVNEIYKTKFSVPLKRDKLIQLQESFFETNISLQKAFLKEFPENIDAVNIYVNSVMNVCFPEISNEIYDFFKKEHNKISDIFVKGIQNNFLTFSFDEDNKNFIVKYSDMFANVPEELVADVALEIIKLENKEIFKRHSKIFLKAINNKYINKISSEEKMKFFNFITSNIHYYIRESRLSFNKKTLLDGLDEIQNFFENIKRNKNIDINTKNNLLKEYSVKLFTLSQMFVFENIRNLFNSGKAGEKLVEEAKKIKEENYAILKKVSKEISKSTGNEEIKNAITFFNKNIKHYIKSEPTPVNSREL